MSEKEAAPGDTITAAAVLQRPASKMKAAEGASGARSEGGSAAHAVAATVGSGGDAAEQPSFGPKPVPLPPPPVIDSLKYYSKQHAKLFGRGKLDQHGRKFPVEAAVRKLKQRGRARFVLERTWYSPLVSSNG